MQKYKKYSISVLLSLKFGDLMKRTVFRRQPWSLLNFLLFTCNFQFLVLHTDLVKWEKIDVCKAVCSVCLLFQEETAPLLGKQNPLVRLFKIQRQDTRPIYQGRPCDSKYYASLGGVWYNPGLLKNLQKFWKGNGIGSLLSRRLKACSFYFNVKGKVAPRGWGPGDSRETCVEQGDTLPAARALLFQLLHSVLGFFPCQCLQFIKTFCESQ